MKFKLFTTALIISTLLLAGGITLAAASKTEIPSSFIYQAVDKYKNGDYTGCIQDMKYLIEHGKGTDVAYYYMANSYSRIGMANEAKNAYSAAISVSNNRMLVEYSRQALECMGNPEACMPTDKSDMTNFIKSGKFIHEDVTNAAKAKAMQKVKDDINKDKAPDPEDLKRINYNMNDKTQPSDKEIADAVRTLAKLGLNPFGQLGGANLAMYGQQNAELMQLNALFGNNNNNNGMMGLLPMLMAGQGSGQEKTAMSKDFIQAYMLNQMMPDMNFGGSDKK